MKKTVVALFISFFILGICTQGYVLANSDAFDAPIVISSNDKQYAIVSAVIRNEGSGFKVLDFGGHGATGIKSVSSSDTNITVNYNFVAKKCLGFSCSNGWTGVRDSYSFGPSVGFDRSILYVYKNPVTFGGYIQYNGSEWVTSAKTDGYDFNAESFSNGELTINHSAIDDVLVSVNSFGNAAYRPVITSLGETTTKLKFYDANGNIVTTPNTNMKVLVTRSSGGPTPVNPNTFTGKALWIIGVFEL